MRRTGEFDGVRVVILQSEAYQNEKFQAENKGLTRLNLFVYRLMSLMNPVADNWYQVGFDPCYLLDWGARCDIAMPKDPKRSHQSCIGSDPRSSQI